MENKFILVLAFLFLIVGVIQINPIIVLFGIVMLLFLIYDNILNAEENRNRIVLPTRKSKFIIVLGNVDLILGGLLLLEVMYNIIPNLIIFVLSLVLFIKAIPFAIGKDIASVIDIICAFFIISFLPLGLPIALTIGISIYLIQKGVLSLFI